MTQQVLGDIILSEHSVRMKERIVEYASANEAHFEEYMHCLSSDNEELVRRAVWPLGELAERRQPWFEPYHSHLIDLLQEEHHDAVHRNVLRAYQTLEIPENEEARLYDACLNKLGVNPLPVAIKVFAMTVAFRIVQRHPGLLEEFNFVLNETMEDTSPGIQSRGRKIKKQLEKL